MCHMFLCMYVMNSDIALCSFSTFCLISWYFTSFDILWNHYYGSPLASEFNQIFIGVIHRVLNGANLFQFFLICRSFLFHAWRNYNISLLQFLSFILGLFYTRFPVSFQLFSCVTRVYVFPVLTACFTDSQRINNR